MTKFNLKTFLKQLFKQPEKKIGLLMIIIGTILVLSGAGGIIPGAIVQVGPVTMTDVREANALSIGAGSILILFGIILYSGREGMKALSTIFGKK